MISTSSKSVKYLVNELQNRKREEKYLGNEFCLSGINEILGAPFFN